MMVFHKEPIITERSQIAALEAKRRYLRSKLRVDVAIARIKLHPKYQFRLWLDRNKAAAAQVADNVGQVAKRNAPLIGAVGLGTIFFMARRPISKWISRFKRPTKTTNN
jgi:hypothetical protein